MPTRFKENGAASEFLKFPSGNLNSASELCAVVRDSRGWRMMSSRRPVAIVRVDSVECFIAGSLAARRCASGSRPLVFCSFLAMGVSRRPETFPFAAGRWRDDRRRDADDDDERRPFRKRAVGQKFSPCLFSSASSSSSFLLFFFLEPSLSFSVVRNNHVTQLQKFHIPFVWRLYTRLFVIFTENLWTAPSDNVRRNLFSCFPFISGSGVRQLSRITSLSSLIMRFFFRSLKPKTRSTVTFF